jgi:hypothetical protein
MLLAYTYYLLLSLLKLIFQIYNYIRNIKTDFFIQIYILIVLFTWSKFPLLIHLSIDIFYYYIHNMTISGFFVNYY